MTAADGGSGTLMRPVAAILVLLLALCASAGAQMPVPQLTARVTDLTGTLSGEAVNRIESKLAAFEAKKGSQIAVLIVPTTQPEEIEQFGIRAFDQWKLGRKGVDDGALLLVAKNDRRVRIEVGTGLEGALPDAIANRIIDETITPHFKLGTSTAASRRESIESSRWSVASRFRSPTRSGRVMATVWALRCRCSWWWCSSRAACCEACSGGCSGRW